MITNNVTERRLATLLDRKRGNDDNAHVGTGTDKPKGMSTGTLSTGDGRTSGKKRIAYDSKDQTASTRRTANVAPPPGHPKRTATPAAATATKTAEVVMSAEAVEMTRLPDPPDPLPRVAKPPSKPRPLKLTIVLNRHSPEEQRLENFQRFTAHDELKRLREQVKSLHPRAVDETLFHGLDNQTWELIRQPERLNDESRWFWQECELLKLTWELDNWDDFRRMESCVDNLQIASNWLRQENASAS